MVGRQDRRPQRQRLQQQRPGRRRPHAASRPVRDQVRLPQPARAAVDLADGRIKVKNWFDFTNPKDLVAGHVGSEGGRQDGRAAACCRRSTSRPARRRSSISRCRRSTPQPGVEYWLNVSFTLKHETRGRRMGHEIAWDQFALPVSKPTARTPGHRRPLGREGRRRRRRPSAARTSRCASTRRTACSRQYRYKGVTLLERGPRARLLARADQQRPRRVEGHSGNGRHEQEPRHRTVARGRVRAGK